MVGLGARGAPTAPPLGSGRKARLSSQRSRGQGLPENLMYFVSSDRQAGWSDLTVHRWLLSVPCLRPPCSQHGDPTQATSAG